MKKSSILIVIFFLMNLIFSLNYGLSQESPESKKGKKESLSKWSKQWLEEVVPFIISSKEKEVFKSLPNEEERGKFIESFWRVRDPDPGTPENEFKIEYYRRIAFANKFLGTAAILGWRTDRGRIYILLGPPGEIRQDFSPSGSSLLTSHAATETWSYMGLPGKNLPYNLEFVFVDKFGTGNYVLKSNTEFGDLSSMHYHFDYMEYIAEVMKTPYENLKELQGIVTTQVTYDLIPMSYNLFYLKGSTEKTFVPLVIEFPYSKLPNKEIEDKYYFSLTFIINISDKLGQVIHQRSKDINFNHTQAELNLLNDKSFQMQTFLSLEPEDYKIHLLVSDNFSGKIGTLHQEISVPMFGRDDLALSDVILSHKTYKADSKKGNFERIFSEVNKTFNPDQELNLYFEIYNLALSTDTGLNHFSIEYFFFRDKDLITHIPSIKPSPTAQSDCRVQTSFMPRNYKPGQYTLQVKVIDSISGKSTTKSARFIIID